MTAFINNMQKKMRYRRFILATIILLAALSLLMISCPLRGRLLLTGDRTSSALKNDDDDSQQKPSLSKNNHTVVSVSRLENKEEIGNHEEQQSSSKQPLHLVICAIIKDEAPYLQEWIEHHKLLGFDEIMLMNDHSTDETQCILDSYAANNNNNNDDDENFLLRRIPDDMNATTFLTSQPFDQCSAIRACEEYLRHRGGPKYQHTWLLTHDVDEFIWFNSSTQTRQSQDQPMEQPDSGSFKDTLRMLIYGQEQEYIGSSESESSSLPPRIHSLNIPRLLFGSSDHNYYDPNSLVMERFTHRFAHQSCPDIIRRPVWKTDFYHTSYCIAMSMEKTSIDNVKSMTWAPALPTTCRHGRVFGCELAPGQVDDRQRCITPHVHGLKKLPADTNTSLRQSQGGPPRSLDAESLLDSVAIMHYITKSREEFFDRSCKSVWLQKYCQCPTCSPEASFNVTQEYANNFHDERMLPFAARVRDAMIMASSRQQSGMQDCKVQPSTSHRDWDYYRQCWKSRMDAIKRSQS